MMKIKIGLLITCFWITATFSQMDSLSILIKEAISETRRAAYAPRVETLPVEEEIPEISPPIKILITRPATKFGDAPLENKWLLLLCEYYLYFRLGGIEYLSIVSPDTLAQLLPNYQDYQHVIPLKEYLDVAKKLSVHYLIYVQCEYSRFISEGQFHLGTEVNFFGTVISPKREAPVVTLSGRFNLRRLGIRLNTFLARAIEKLKIEITEINSTFLATPVISKRSRSIKKLGMSLSSFYGSDVPQWNYFIRKYKRLLRRDSRMILGYYAGAKICEVAGKYKDGASLSYGLIDRLDITYPNAFIMTSELYRLSGNYEQSLRVIESAPDIDIIKNDLKIEKAYIYKRKGEVKKAIDLALEVLKEDSNNRKARIFSQMFYSRKNEVK